jgi:probable rRNA maturation factor
MSEIINRQRKIKLERQIFQVFAENVVSQIPETANKSVTIAFVSDRKMRELNKTFRGKNSTTDVLSFPFEADEFEILSEPSASAGGFLGDIIISAEQAARQASENDLDLETEIKQLILHGVLHLCGYDHETDNGEMNAKEIELRDKLEIN